MRTRRSVRSAHVLAGVVLTAALAVTGCSASGDEAGSKAAGPGVAADEKGAVDAAPESGKQGAPGGTADRSVPSAPRPATEHIIRTASLTVRVKDVPAALDEARAATTNAGGYVGDETTRRDAVGDERTRVVLRVPVDAYDKVLAALEGTGTLVERNANAEDVTDQVVDVESRITSQRASVARIRELMDRATRLSDVVTLEGELSTRQADLESLLAQQASLKDRASLATITLTLSESPAEKEAKDEEPGFVDALAGGWGVFLTLLRWLLLALGAVLPFAAVAALVVLVWSKLISPRVARRPRPGPAADGGTGTGTGSLPVAPPVPGRAPGSGNGEA
ncbi:DUF4349 domain-containing protein [Streptomyces althioticus]|uniref:DUF4349 domain-containing protein n=1 Tax=Streptomyces althioticus TaxID=83380 RepID=UPI0037A6306A